MGIQRHIAAAAVAVVVASALCPARAFAAPASSDALRAEAKVSQEQATATALGRVRQGTVKSVELEKENGKLVWSFDIARPRTKGVTEIQVDAITGKVVLMKKESAAQEAREAKAETREAAPAE